MKFYFKKTINAQIQLILNFHGFEIACIANVFISKLSIKESCLLKTREDDYEPINSKQQKIHKGMKLTDDLISAIAGK